MKTKSEIVIPIGVILFAMSCSFVTQASKKSVNTLVPGYITPLGSCCCIML